MPWLTRLLQTKLLTKFNINISSMGIPMSMKPWIEERLLQANRRKDEPPTIQQVVDILISRFDKNRLSFEPWIHASEPTILKVTETPDSQLKQVIIGVPSSNTTLTSIPAADASIEDLITMMQKLDIKSFHRVTNTCRNNLCPMCSEKGKDLDHIPTISQCPITDVLLNDGSIKKNGRHFTLSNGDELSKKPAEGGIVKAV
jgi:hypothetical protein